MPPDHTQKWTAFLYTDNEYVKAEIKTQYYL